MVFLCNFGSMTAFKKLITKIGLFALQRGAVSISHFNKEVQQELQAWPNGFTIKIAVKGDPMAIVWEKTKNGLKTSNPNLESFDLIIYFKNLNTAFNVITTLSNVPESFTQNRIQAFGYNPDSMILIRILNVVQAYLFPPILSKRVLKRVPKFSLNQHVGRIRVYTLGLIFAK